MTVEIHRFVLKMVHGVTHTEKLRQNIEDVMFFNVEINV